MTRRRRSPHCRFIGWSVAVDSFEETVSQYALQIFTSMNDSTDSLLEKNPRFASYCEPPTRETPRNNGTLNFDVRSILPVRIQKHHRFTRGLSLEPLDTSLEVLHLGRMFRGSIQLNPIHAVLTATLQFRISTGPSPLPQGLRDPPAYSLPPSPRPVNATLASPAISDEPPAYSTLNVPTPPKEKNQSSSDPPAEDVLHFLDPSQDSILSLSLRYGVPQDALKRKNGLFADHLLAARRTILIPGEFYKGGVSLSPEPMESEEEEIRKAKIRRWMVA